MRFHSSFLALSALAAVLPAQDGAKSFGDAAAVAESRLSASLTELSELRERIAGEKTALDRQLNELELQLSQLRAEGQQKSRAVDLRTLAVNNLRNEVKAHEDEANYLTSLLTDYRRNLEARLHIAEMRRYEAPLERARLASENTTLGKREVFEAQLALLGASLDRLHDAAGGTLFAGRAVDGNGLVRDGTFALVGPVALFRSADGTQVGGIEQRLGSLEPSIMPFERPQDAEATGQFVAAGGGAFPFDATLGNAHKVEATHETFWEHVQRGGPVMIPIFAMAGIALLIALYKWVSLSWLPRPSRKQVASLLESVGRRDHEAARQKAQAMPGPVGQMLRTGVENMDESRELVEEVMYETVLTTRLRVNRLLPFVSICAASAPLLGLLGTVTGIIATFKTITVFGSTDVGNLSGGISEALITTEFGLIVAIPSLLLHAFLSRKARRVVGDMEQFAVAFANEVAKSAPKRPAPAPARAQAAMGAVPDPDLVREQVNQILGEILGPLVSHDHAGYAAAHRAHPE